MRSETRTSTLLSCLTVLILIATLQQGVVSLPTVQRDAVDGVPQTSNRPVPLPKLKNYQFSNSNGPPNFYRVSFAELSSYTEITSDLPSSVTSVTTIEPSDIQGRDVIGADNRVVVHNSSFPYSAIGRIIWSDMSYCTGTLVGDRIVATASHCVPWGQSTISMIFQPSFYDTNVYPSASVTDVAYVEQQTMANFDASACGLEKDFAILKLSNVLSGTLGGYFNVTTSLAAGLVHAGYPSDLAAGARPYQQTGLTASVSNSLKCDPTGPLSTTADASGGQSGGPLYIPQIKYIIGVLSAGTSTTTVFASGTSFVSMVNWARANWPA